MSDLLPVVAGGVLTLAGGAWSEWLRDRRAGARDEQNRWDRRKRERDEFQRRTLLELQDALQGYSRGVTAAAFFDHMSMREHGKQTMLPEEMSEQVHETQMLTIKLATRIDDDEVRALIDQVIERAADAVVPGAADGLDVSRQAFQIASQAQEKMGSLIRIL